MVALLTKKKCCTWLEVSQLSLSKCTASFTTQIKQASSWSS